MTTPGEQPLHEDDPAAVLNTPGGLVRNLTPEEYAATYATGTPHSLPADVLAAVEADSRGLRFGASSGGGLKWMPAKAYGGKLAASVVVVHCTESDNNAGTAESLAGPNWFGGSKAGTSAHKMFDRDSGVEMVKPTLVAFHAGPRGNTVGISYEFCGRASWSWAKWREPAQLTALKLAAPHIADDLRSIGAGARWLSLAQLAGKARGMCTHNDVRLALGGTTHSDPGPNFPYAELLSYVQAALAGTPAPAVQEDDDMPYTLDQISDAVVKAIRKDPLWIDVADENGNAVPTSIRTDQAWADTFVQQFHGIPNTPWGPGNARSFRGVEKTLAAMQGRMAGLETALAQAAAGQPFDLVAVQAASKAGTLEALAEGVVDVDVTVNGPRTIAAASRTAADGGRIEADGTHTPAAG